MKSTYPLHSAFAFERFQTGSKTDVLRTRIGNPPGYPDPFINLWLPSAGGEVTLYPADIAIGISIAGYGLTQDHLLTPANETVSIAVIGAGITQVHSLTPANAIIDTTIPGVAIDTAIILTPANVAIGSEIAAASLMQEHQLNCGNMNCSTSMDGADVIQEYNLEPFEILLLTDVTQTALTQVHALETAGLELELCVSNSSIDFGGKVRTKSMIMSKGMALETEVLRLDGQISAADKIRLITKKELGA
jgi:hypothetical protein